jgi:hypothetical protein
MNKRIKEIESQCWEPSQYGPDWFNSTKFAELIVKECVQTVQDRGGMCGALASNWIKEHFGVI